MRNPQTSMALTLGPAAIGRLVLSLLALPILLAACSSSDPTEVVKEWERSLNLFEHRCEPVYEAASDLRSDADELHALRSGNGTEQQRQVVEDFKDCNDSHSDLVVFLEDHEDALVAEWGSNRYTGTLKVWESAEKEIRKVSQDLGPYPTKTEELAEDERLRTQAQRERERKQAREQQAEERAACPNHIRYGVRGSNGRGWAVAKLREDGGLEIWVAASASSPAEYERCLNLDETRRTATDPKPGYWYSSGTYTVPGGSSIKAQAMLDASGQLKLRLRGWMGLVPVPAVGTTYLNTTQGSLLTFR